MKAANGATLTSSGKTVGERNIHMDRNHLWYSGCPSFSRCERHVIGGNGRLIIMLLSELHVHILKKVTHIPGFFDLLV